MSGERGAEIPDVAGAWGRRFAEVRPAATLALEARRTDPSLRVEIEAEARRRSGQPG